MRFVNAEAAGRNRGRAQAQPTGHKGRLRIVGYSVLVYSDIRIPERRIGSFTRNTLLDQADQHQVIVGSARDNRVAPLGQQFGHRLGVVADQPLVGRKFRCHCLFERNRFRGNYMHQWAALVSRENQRTEFFGQLIVRTRKNQAAARTTQCLVCRGRHDVGHTHRARVVARGDEPGDVCHINHQVSTSVVGDFAEFLPVHNA